MASPAARAQTRDDLFQKYGRPNSDGRFVARPTIGLFAKERKDGSLSEIVIEPLDPSVSKVMSSEEVENVLNEIVPASTRGKINGQGHIEFSCTSVYLTEYERVTTNLVKRCKEQGGGTRSITVRWKTPSVQRPTAAKKVSPMITKR